MMGNQVLGVKKLVRTKSMVAKEREQCSVAVMQLHRIGKSPRQPFESSAKSSDSLSEVLLISKVKTSSMSRSFIVFLTPVADDLKSPSNLRPEPDVFKTSIQTDKDRLLCADFMRCRINSASAARKSRISSEASRTGASDSTVMRKDLHMLLMHEKQSWSGIFPSVVPLFSGDYMGKKILIISTSKKF